MCFGIPSLWFWGWRLTCLPKELQLLALGDFQIMDSAFALWAVGIAVAISAAGRFWLFDFRTGGQRTSFTMHCSDWLSPRAASIREERYYRVFVDSLQTMSHARIKDLTFVKPRLQLLYSSMVNSEFTLMYYLISDHLSRFDAVTIGYTLHRCQCGYSFQKDFKHGQEHLRPIPSLIFSSY